MCEKVLCLSVEKRGPSDANSMLWSDHGLSTQASLLPGLMAGVMSEVHIPGSECLLERKGKG
jgi:hypothetical protein